MFSKYPTIYLLQNLLFSIFCLQNIEVLTNNLIFSWQTLGRPLGNSVHIALHIEDFTRARVNESDLTAVLVETGAMPVPTKSRNPTACV